MLRMTQMIDTLDPEESKRYIHHYNFPPFSTGEVGRVGSPKRREIGHGALAERALVAVIPDEEEFPYTLRLVSDVLSSNGSTSMASVCASTLSLMDAGVPIKAPVAGIAMGLIAEDSDDVTLTDILRAVIAVAGADIRSADGGRVFVGTREGEGAEQAIHMIEEVANPRMPELGERFEGTVVKTTTFGAFVNITPARDGLVHISKLGRGKRLSSVEEAVNVGQKLMVEVQELKTAPSGKIEISLKPVGEGWEPPEG